LASLVPTNIGINFDKSSCVCDIQSSPVLLSEQKNWVLLGAVDNMGDTLQQWLKIKIVELLFLCIIWTLCFI